jgi:hypothetical protein
MVNTQPAYQPEAGSYFNMMANIDGYAQLDTSGQVIVANSQFSPGVTFLKAGTGLYSVNFPKGYSYDAPFVSFSAPTAVALFPQVQSINSSGFVIRLVNGSGAATDPSASCAVYFLCRARDSSVVR